MKKPLILMILDGFGIAPEKGNAIKAANKPNIDKLFAENPVTQIGASGMDVGLPDGQMGNSEVGHTNMGAGRIVYQELTRITKTINEDKLKENEAIVNAMDKAIENGTSLTRLAGQRDGPAVLLHDAANDKQPQSGAGGLGGQERFINAAHDLR